MKPTITCVKNICKKARLPVIAVDFVLIRAILIFLAITREHGEKLMMTGFLKLSILAFSFSAALSIASPAYGKKNLEKGMEIFVRNCSKCHSLEASGQNPNNLFGGWKSNGERIPPALNGTAHAWNHSTRELFSIIKSGSFDKNSSMRPQKELLSDYEIICVIQYIKSLWPKEIRAKHNELFGKGKNGADLP